MYLGLHSTVFININVLILVSNVDGVSLVPIAKFLIFYMAY